MIDLQNAISERVIIAAARAWRQGTHLKSDFGFPLFFVPILLMLAPALRASERLILIL